MSNKCTFEQYYGQFVNEATKKIVVSTFTLKKLKEAYKKDKHLNTIPLFKWDALGGFAFRGSEMIARPTTIEPIDYKLLKEAGEGVSSATLVCIYKESARQVIRK